MLSQTEKGQAFAALHRTGIFIIPNPWDAGTARLLEHLGFKALATTSSGFAFAVGETDDTIGREETMLRGVHQCTSFDWRDVRKDAHQRATTEMRQTAACFTHEMRQHASGRCRES